MSCYLIVKKIAVMTKFRAARTQYRAPGNVAMVSLYRRATRGFIARGTRVSTRDIMAKMAPTSDEPPTCIGKYATNST